jgi:hypothetical protein
MTRPGTRAVAARHATGAAVDAILAHPDLTAKTVTPHDRLPERT